MIYSIIFICKYHHSQSFMCPNQPILLCFFQKVFFANSHFDQIVINNKNFQKGCISLMNPQIIQIHFQFFIKCLGSKLYFKMS